MFNVISPFGRVVKYEPEDRKGFFTHPKSDSAPNGWTPGVDEETGAPILPGTPSGDKPYKFLGNGDGLGWRCVTSPGDFLYGEIDWVGKPKLTDKPERGNHRLSFHGPASRHFGSEGFRYGSEDKHNNIYYEGLCVSVAPYPVLGACMKQIEILNTETGEPTGFKEWWVICICKNETKDVVYKRKWRSGVFKSGYTEEFRTKQMLLYDEEDNPDGWVHLAETELLESEQGTECKVMGARTPWFFNESGSYASCVRDCEIKFTVNDVIGEDTQKGHALFTVAVPAQADTATFQDRANDPPYQLRISSVVKRFPDRTTNTKFPYSATTFADHTWELYTCMQKWEGSGSQIIAVDYDKDIEIVCKLKMHVSRQNNTEYMYGADPGAHPVEGVTSNNGSIVGDLYTWLAEGVDTDWLREGIPQNDPGLALNMDEHLALDTEKEGFGVHWLYRAVSGSRTKFLTGESDYDTDPWLYFFFYRNTYPHYFSLRHKHSALFVEDRTFEQSGVNTVFDADSEQYYIGDKDYEIYMEKVKPKSELIWPGGLRAWSTYTIVGDFAHDVTETRECKTYTGQWPAALFDAWPTDNPSPLDFYNTQNVAWNEFSVPVDLLLHSSKAFRMCGFAEDDFGNKIMSVEYLNHEDKVATYNKLTDGDPVGLSKASGENIKFFPIGAS